MHSARNNVTVRPIQTTIMATPSLLSALLSAPPPTPSTLSRADKLRFNDLIRRAKELEGSENAADVEVLGAARSPPEFMLPACVAGGRGAVSRGGHD